MTHTFLDSIAKTLVVVIALLFATDAMAEAVVTQVSGDVQIGRGDPTKWSAAKTGDAVAFEDRVRTGPDGRVELKMAAGTLRVHENSMLRLPPAIGHADQVELDQGRSLFDVVRRGGRRFEVHTPTVVVSVKGTRFGVDAGVDIGEVTVYRGTVGVREVGADAMMETLVREGFLATGGVGIPVELDVSAARDPWKDWQQFDRALEQERLDRIERMSDVERARATLHRATAAEVIMKAAERRPEIAERLSEMERQRRRDMMKSQGGPATDVDEDATPAIPDLDDGGAMPAAPDLDDDDDAMLDPRTMMRQRMRQQMRGEANAMRMEMMQNALEAQILIDAAKAEDDMEMEETSNVEELTSNISAAGGPIEFHFEEVYGLSPAALGLVIASLNDLQAQFDSGTFVPTTEAELTMGLTNELIARGVSASDAATIVNVLIGN